MRHNHSRDEASSDSLLKVSRVYGTYGDEILIQEAKNNGGDRRNNKQGRFGLLFALLICGISALAWNSLRNPTTHNSQSVQTLTSMRSEMTDADFLNEPTLPTLAKKKAASGSGTSQDSQDSEYFEPSQTQHSEPKPISPKEKKEKNKEEETKGKSTSSGEGEKPKSKSASPKSKSEPPKPKSASPKPKSSTQEPKASTQEPKASTQEPKASTTQKPKASTQNPKASTQNPRASTQKPEPEKHHHSSKHVDTSPTPRPSSHDSEHSRHSKHKTHTHNSSSSTKSPTPTSTASPSPDPSMSPSPDPSMSPSASPSLSPSSSPSALPSALPSYSPSSSPSSSPSALPSALPSYSPSSSPSPLPTSPSPLPTTTPFDTDGEGFNTKPHIILVLVDDMGFNDISYNNDPELVNQVETPFIKQLARSGVILEKFYAFADCTPSRAALLTSVHPLTSGMYMDTINYDSEWGLPLRYNIIPQHLKAANYTSHIVGKWDIGHYTKMLTPIERGFDSFLGYFGSSVDYYTHEVTQTQYCETTACKYWLNKCDGSVFTDFHWNKEYLQTLNYSTDVYEHRVESIIDEYVEKGHTDPLFLYVAHQAPHSPHEASNETKAYFQSQFLTGEKGWRRRASFAACLYELDCAIQSMVEKLQAGNLYSRSYIFFMSDNGAVPGKLGGGSNWPLRGGKFLPYEGGVRVPAFVHSPMLPRKRWGSTLTSLVHITDILPTILNLAGIGEIRGAIDGISFLESLFTGEEGDREEVLVFADVADKNDRSQWFGGYIHKDWKIIINATEAGWYSPDSIEYATTEMGYTKPEVYTDRAARHGDYSTYFNASALYYLKTDPSERINLIHEHPRVFNKLKKRFLKYVAHAVDAEYDCGCNCEDDGCAYLYEWFYHHSCFVYPWSSDTNSETPSTTKPATPVGIDPTDDDNPSVTGGSQSSSNLPDLIANDRTMQHAPVRALT